MIKINIVLVLFLVFIGTLSMKSQDKKPNILFVMIDDLNDWIEPLDGNKQVKTPNLDKFTKKGTIVFKNAVCAAPVCGPSRSALLSGFMPSTSGVYNNTQNMIYSDLVKKNATLPEYFSKHGYYSLGNGKIFHKHGAEFGTDFGHWAFDEFARARRGHKDHVDRKFLTSSKAGMIRGEKSPEFVDKKSKLSWGPLKDSFENTVDYKVADWAVKKLDTNFEKPFFMAVGFIKPHLPWYVPKQFFDMYDVDKIKAPIVKEDDLKDILKPNGKQAYWPTKEYKWVKKHGLEKEATRAYLANISYVDACFGVLMDALEKSKYADNTIVVVCGDHGWHLGEKSRYLKETTWIETVKTPLLVSLPEMKERQYSDKNVSLLDLYPTMVSLAGLPKKENLEGHDFSELLKKPEEEWNYPGITISNRGTSILSGKWHYTKSLKGVEELYNLEKDPMEWTNLIERSKYKSVVKRLKKWVPKKRKTPSTIVFKKARNYVNAPSDPTIKKTRDLKKLK